MTKSPIINALAAVTYITLVSFVMNYASSRVPGPDGKNLLGPIAFVSLFTLSAAVMGYIFFYQPFQLSMANKKDQAVKLFLQTLAVFAGITILFFILVFSGLIK